MNVCKYCFPEHTGIRPFVDELCDVGIGSPLCDIHHDQAGASIDEVTTKIDAAFREHFTSATFVSNAQQDLEIKSAAKQEHGKSITECVVWLTGLSEENNLEASILTAIVTELVSNLALGLTVQENDFYGNEARYIFNDAEKIRKSKWDDFSERVKYQHRYIKHGAEKDLSEIFKGLDNLDNVIYPLDENYSIYRARAAEDIDEANNFKLNAGNCVCAPPGGKKCRANRLNPSGIRCFYGAEDQQTAISELRPPVDGVGVVAKFILLRPVYILDTTSFESSPAYPTFGEHSAESYKLHRFMEHFMHEISKPTQPLDEHIDYVPTQIIAEYFIHTFSSSELQSGEMMIEGIKYKSAQTRNGINIALFGNAAATLQDILSDDDSRLESDNDQPILLTQSEIMRCGVSYERHSAKVFRVSRTKHKIMID